MLLTWIMMIMEQFDRGPYIKKDSKTVRWLVTYGISQNVGKNKQNYNY